MDQPVRVWITRLVAAVSLASAALLSAAEPPQKLVFCAYNVKNWLNMDRFNQSRVEKAAPKPEPEKAAVVGTLVSIRPDVIGLSEIGTLEDLTEIQLRLKQAGLDLPHLEITEGEDPNRRLGLLTRFPITSRQSPKDLAYKIKQEKKSIQRGLLDVTLSPIPDLHLRFMGVHLKSMREIPGIDQALMRRNEAQLVRQHLDAALESDPTTRILLYGDFNEHRNGVAIKAILGSRTSSNYMEELLLTDPNGQVWTHFWDAADSYSRLDYVFYSRSLKPLISKSESFIFHTRDFDQASDHRPLVVTLELRP
jgi:endonuclease/exonuclease/phosphatase family metal-dependent hydrolase